MLIIRSGIGGWGILVHTWDNGSVHRGGKKTGTGAQETRLTYKVKGIIVGYHGIYN